ncbi:MAG TPA: hypothetical protein VEI83_02370 [Acidimicrobiales bacterium]|nr:hypothetical protein [Acidimicrobiales bacterium]
MTKPTTSATPAPARCGLIRLALALVALACLLAGCAQAPTAVLTTGHGPAGQYACRYDTQTDAFTGAYATASAIGWEGNSEGVVTCLGGSFYVQSGINRGFGFGIYNGAATSWADLDGYLPAQVTTFARSGATVTITEFADRIVIDGDPFVAVYCRVAISNPTGRAVVEDPDPSPGLVVLATAPTTVRAYTTAQHDYVVAVDRFGNSYAWPKPADLAAAGGFGPHLAHMRSFWNTELGEIADLQLPDTSLVNAYRSGFILTQIARSGDELYTGVNGYDAEYNHDVIGILANLFTQGYFAGAHSLLLRARAVIGSQDTIYPDGTWTYAWPWAIYLMKTGDIGFVRANFSSGVGPGGGGPSIEETAHEIGTDRTGPGGIMMATDDIDTTGYWTVDDFEALMGLAAYRYLASRLGNQGEVQWATAEYDALLSATDATLEDTVQTFGLDYLPCSILQPNTANRCSNPADANWAATLQFGKWAWDAPLLGTPVSGPAVALIDPTYRYGFDRLRGIVPPDTFGGFPSDFYSSGYNAGYGSWGLAGSSWRSQGIAGYEFMIRNTQSGPYSWWESSGPPDPASPWVGSHPGAGQGSSPHAWGMAEANKVLLDSLVAQESTGELIVGRGIPAEWLGTGDVVSVGNFPTLDGRRVDVRISSSGGSVSLTIRGSAPHGAVLFELPEFVDNVAAASAGTVDETDGIVTLPPSSSSVSVQLGPPPG